MEALIAKAHTATTEKLMEMAMLLTDSTAKEGRMASMAVMVVLEERLGPDQFNAFAVGLDASSDLYDDEEDFDWSEPEDCDCADHDTDLIEGRAWCSRCGRRWGMTAEEIKREIEFQSNYMAQFDEASLQPDDGSTAA